MATPTIGIEREEWRPVVGYEGIYSVSCLGRVRREYHRDKNHKPGSICVSTPDTKGYPQLRLSKPGTRRTWKVHRLVALAFLGPRPEGTQINHKSGLKADNRITNLEYVTPRENAIHALRVLGAKRAVGERASKAVLTEEQVIHLRTSNFDGIGYREIAAMYGVRGSDIHRAMTGKTWAYLNDRFRPVTKAPKPKNARKQAIAGIDTTTKETGQ